MSLTHAQQLAFARQILEILKNNKDTLEDKGVDVSGRIRSLQRQIANAEGLEADQQQEQAEAREATEASNESRATAYDDASSAVELIVGALGKDNALVKEIKNLRDEMANESLRGPRDEEEKPE